MNKSLLSNSIVFVVGIAIGAVASMRYFKTKYEQIAQQEINSVKEMYAKRQEKFSTLRDYIDRATGYTGGSTDEDTTDTEGKEETVVEKPYVIAPDEFGEADGYSIVSLTYYADGTLADDNDEPVEDVDNTVGCDSLSHFGEYEDDSVFVRNDARKTDYEILLDVRNYSDVMEEMSHLGNDE